MHYCDVLLSVQNIWTYAFSMHQTAKSLHSGSITKKKSYQKYHKTVLARTQYDYYFLHNTNGTELLFWYKKNTSSKFEFLNPFVGLAVDVELSLSRVVVKVVNEDARLKLDYHWYEHVSAECAGRRRPGPSPCCEYCQTSQLVRLPHLLRTNLQLNNAQRNSYNLRLRRFATCLLSNNFSTSWIEPCCCFICVYVVYSLHCSCVRWCGLKYLKKRYNYF